MGKCVSCGAKPRFAMSMCDACIDALQKGAAKIGEQPSTLGSAASGGELTALASDWQVESGLKAWGLFFAIAGLTSALALIYLAGSGEEDFNSFYLGLGLAVGIQGLFMRTVLRAAAEVIVLLRGK